MPADDRNFRPTWCDAPSEIGVTGQFSVSELEHVVVCRYLGGRATECKALFTLAWDALRQARQGKPAMAPRVWST